MAVGGDQPLGGEVVFDRAPTPTRTLLSGRLVTLRPLDPEADGPELYRRSHPDNGDRRIWTYLPYGPFLSTGAYLEFLRSQAVSEDPLFFTILSQSDGRPSGIASYLAIVPEHGTIEIGHIWFAPEIQRTSLATEAIYLLARHAFELGYRRLEWKCDALNAPSRAAAERFGFLYEGTFAQHRVVKGRNRDTAWLAIVADRWPALREAFETWLDPSNFDSAGHQRQSLSGLTADTAVG